MTKLSDVKIITNLCKTTVYVDGEKIDRIFDIKAHWDNAGRHSNIIIKTPIITIKRFANIELNTPAIVDMELYIWNGKKYRLVEIEEDK